MRVSTVTRLEEADSVCAGWNDCAGGCPFRSWTWLSTWWRHYGRQPSRQLRLWLVFDEAVEGSNPTLAAVLPCYLDSSWARGRVLRLLGDGEVASDHLGLLLRRPDDMKAIGALADGLVADSEWDVLDFSAIDEDDAPSRRLFEALAERGCTTSHLAADRTWAIDLPASWDEFLALQSKSHRKQLRQLERRVLDGGDASWRLTKSADEFPDAWKTLVDLHQRRRQCLGQPGCFASTVWAEFHWEVARRLLDEGGLRLSILELAGRPIAAEYHLAGGDAIYAYQGGVDPDRLHDEPGQLSTIRTIQHAIAEGRRTFDFLRGDEPYKAHWRARPRQAWRMFAVPARGWPQLRHRTFAGITRAREIARQLTTALDASTH